MKIANLLKLTGLTATKSVSLSYLVSFVLAMCLASNASAWVYWYNTSGDGLWSTGTNWTGGNVPTSTDDVWLQSTLATVGPTIDSSTAAICNKILGPGSKAGSMTMSINGGSLTTVAAAGYWSIGQDTGPGTADVNGGTVSVTGTLYVGNQSSGTLNVSGGSVIDVTGALRTANSNGATDIGHINLGLGTLSCEDIFGTSGKTLIDITDGTLIIRNKSGGSIDSWVIAGWIIGYGGVGTVICEKTPKGWDKLTAVGEPATACAWNPSPADNAEDVDPNADISWSQGKWATSHDVYFGTVDPPPFIRNQALDANSYDPGTLDLGETYYWRINEVNEPNTWEGQVWSFTVHFVADDIEWDDGGTGHLWTTEENWVGDLLPGSSNHAILRPETASGANSPVIDENAAVQVYGIFAGYDAAVEPAALVMTGGALNIGSTGLHIGYVADAVFNISGGTVETSGWLWLGEGNEGGYGTGTLNMAGGEIYAEALSFAINDGSPDFNYLGGVGIANLKAGKISVGSVQGLHFPCSLIDIEEGILLIDGDVRAEVDQWVGSGHLAAYNGNGLIERSYNTIYPNKTIITAIDNSNICNEPAWWDSLIRIVETAILSVAQEHNINVWFNHSADDPGWGLYGQKVTEAPSRKDQADAAGLKSISYYETYGGGACFIAELDEVSTSPEYNSIHCHHWCWQLYDGGEIVWVGSKNFWDDEEFARPWTRTHPIYGGPPMTYPDGTIATGYFDNDDTDPRKSRVYDASSSKDILGNLNLSYGYNSSIQSSGPYDGALYIPEDDKWATLVGVRKDASCSLWTDYTYASALYATESGMHGMWSDNFSSWDSFGNEPVKAAFGDWSVACFRDYLSENFTTTELANMGVSNVSTFDIRDKLKEIATGWGWNGSDLGHSAWDNLNWQNKPIWQAYIIYKRQSGTEALTEYSDAVHKAAEENGISDFLLLGNDIPIFNLGWARGNLDMVSSEMTAGWNLCSGPRGFMLPPTGRISPAYKVAREHAKSRFVNVWFYKNGYEQYLTNPGICNVLYSEMLANNTTPMFLPKSTVELTRTIGTPQINGDFFDFVSQVEEFFGRRKAIEDIGIYYSSSSILNQILPGGVINFSAQPHQFAHWGWATALGQLHYQYKAVPEWKLDNKILEDLQVLIIPESEIFDDSDVNVILQPWVETGGRLIVTGVSGKRLGENGNFEVNPSGYSLAPLTGISNIAGAPAEQLQTIGSGKVLYIRDNIGMEYFNANATRPSLLPDFQDAMDTILAGAGPVVLTPGAGVSSSVSLTVFEDICAGKLFVDIVNYNINLTTDQITNTPQMTFDIAKPYWLEDKNITVAVVSPDIVDYVSIDTVSIPGRIELTIAPVKYYAGVIIEFVLDADIDNDLKINLQDFSKLASKWMCVPCYAANNWCDESDIDLSNTVDMNDVTILAENWLAGK
jgi:hypothetical protein